MTGAPPQGQSTSGPARVVVVGGVNVDVIAASAGALLPRVSNPGRVRIRAGGTGRNVAENLARLGISTRLLAAVEAHPLAEIAVQQAASVGVDVSGVVRVRGYGSTYVAIEQDGMLEWAVSDMSAAEALTPGDLDAEASALHDAEMVVVDANLAPAAIRRAAELAGGRLGLLPVSAAKAVRVRAVLARALLLVLSGREAAVLTGMKVENRDDALRAGAVLRNRTHGTVVVTMGAEGLGWITDGPFWTRAVPVQVIEPSGAGDAVAAIAVLAHLTGADPRQAARLAAAAAALTITVESATHPHLSLEALHAIAREPA